MQPSLCATAEHPPKSKTKTVAQGVKALSDGECGKSLSADFQESIIAGRRLASRPKLRADEHVRARARSGGKVAALPSGEVRLCR